jgi:hypothetical protein
MSFAGVSAMALVGGPQLKNNNNKNIQTLMKNNLVLEMEPIKQVRNSKQNATNITTSKQHNTCHHT